MFKLIKNKNQIIRCINFLYNKYSKKIFLPNKNLNIKYDKPFFSKLEKNLINRNTNIMIIIDNIINKLNKEFNINYIDVSINKYINEFIAINYSINYIIYELLKNSIRSINKKKALGYIFNENITINIIKLDGNMILIKIKDNGIGQKDNASDFTISMCNIHLNYLNCDNNNIKINNNFEKGTTLYIFLKIYI